MIALLRFCGLLIDLSIRTVRGWLRRHGEETVLDSHTGLYVVRANIIIHRMRVTSTQRNCKSLRGD